MAVLSRGPVGIGDGPNYTNASLVHRTCTADGTLLHPSRSATPIDAMYYNATTQRPIGEIWSTHSAISVAAEGSGTEASDREGGMEGGTEGGKRLPTADATAVWHTVLTVGVSTPYPLLPHELFSGVTRDSAETENVVWPLLSGAPCVPGAVAVSCMKMLTANTPCNISSPPHQDADLGMRGRLCKLCLSLSAFCGRSGDALYLKVIYIDTHCTMAI